MPPPMAPTAETVTTDADATAAEVEENATPATAAEVEG